MVLSLAVASVESSWFAVGEEGGTGATGQDLKERYCAHGHQARDLSDCTLDDPSDRNLPDRPSCCRIKRCDGTDA